MARRSARLSKAAQQQDQPASARRTPSTIRLESLVERDETPDDREPLSIDNVLATPASAATVKSQLSRLSGLKTPKTEPRVDRAEMHPGLVHQSTAKAPDSGLKLGFVDIPAQPPHSLASAQNTPSKAQSSTPAHLSAKTFDFKFGSDSQLSTEAQKLMDNVREEAARIKAQMLAEKKAQLEKDAAAETAFDGIHASGRKIAKPRGQAGRFSDVHIAQFKKMDSIANHPSAFRSRPGFAQPTTQSLKRSPSKAGLDEPDRPRTAGKGTPGRQPPPFLGRPTSVSPFKSIPAQTTSVKRARQSEMPDVSAGRQSEDQMTASTLPKLAASSLLSPTKSSLAKAASSHIPVASPIKQLSLSRTTSMRSLKAVSTAPIARPSTSNGVVRFKPPGPPSISQPPHSQEPPRSGLKGLSGIGFTSQPGTLQRAKSITDLGTAAERTGFASKLPTFSGLKSILRPGHRSNAMTSIEERPGTPKRPNTATSIPGSAKKVDFTPRVKSRYAVKLAAGSPSPAKLPHLTPAKPQGPVVPYDPAAYMLHNDKVEDEWEDAESEIEYPVLPTASSSPATAIMETSFKDKARNHNRRESKEFKSIFTTLHHPSRSNESSTLTSVNTVVNQTNPTIHANKVMTSPHNVNLSKPSPNTIRRVRTSGVSELVQPFEDSEVKTVPHGLPGKKRRRESTMSGAQEAQADAGKENRRVSVLPSIPGGWQDTPKLEEVEDEGMKRGGKRARVATGDDLSGKEATMDKAPSGVKKLRPNSAREMAKNNAKERKGILSLSRLNMLSRPKQRG
ncbi:uncharacterized protein A1O9_06407 [Exophiala aquamarina CBS 119918]|uniref:Erythromycin esterase n=1 Tax=Exophiala aquamarina CBS 119918 TaxID=1182545 RepID=A0A072PF28_9EURO|nr:uncharacterized protein A1O9_06407 [Exophiala aquamarina CBS 119918]KEF58481.1 hypothetical protein A1O9_06407 [Exophiala aquamarina CBS 119918]